MIPVQRHRLPLQKIYTEVVNASSVSCFPPEIALAIVSRKGETLNSFHAKKFFDSLLLPILRLSINDTDELITTEDGWRPCLLNQYFEKRCYGLMQIPESRNPNTTFAPDSMEHFEEAIRELISLTTKFATLESFTPTQQTRAGLAAYDAGFENIDPNCELTF